VPGAVAVEAEGGGAVGAVDFLFAG
jgi:hypothetical protein